MNDKYTITTPTAQHRPLIRRYRKPESINFLKFGSPYRIDEMIIRCLLFLIQAVIAQIPPQPIVTTGSACLNGCLQQGSLVFAAANLRNFQKIILNIEQFCGNHEQLMKCAQSCTSEERQNLAEKIALSDYICKDKLEEFRLVKECMEGQEIEYVNKCASDCGLPSSATIQLDSSPAAAVNPFAFFDSITPVCRTIECIIKCSIAESNEKCAGSGDLFRDIGFKQVLEASERLHNDIFNSSSSVAQQLAKIYLESLPEQCVYIIDPVKYDTMFVEHETNDNPGMITSSASDIQGNTARSSSATGEEEMKPTTTERFSANNDEVITRIFDIQIETKSTEAPPSTSTHNTATEKETRHEATITTARSEFVNEPDNPLKSIASDKAAFTTESSNNRSAQFETPIEAEEQPVASQTDDDHILGQEEQATLPLVTLTSTESKNVEEGEATTAGHDEEESEAHEHDPGEEEEESEHELMVTSSETAATMVLIHKSNESEGGTTRNNEKVTDLQHLSSTTATTERTIVVVNEDDEKEIDTNVIVHQEHIVPDQQKDLKKSGTCGKITLSLSLIFPLLPFYFSKQ